MFWNGKQSNIWIKSINLRKWPTYDSFQYLIDCIFMSLHSLSTQTLRQSKKTGVINCILPINRSIQLLCSNCTTDGRTDGWTNICKRWWYFEFLTKGEMISSIYNRCGVVFLLFILPRFWLYSVRKTWHRTLFENKTVRYVTVVFTQLIVLCCAVLCCAYHNFPHDVFCENCKAELSRPLIRQNERSIFSFYIARFHSPYHCCLNIPLICFDFDIAHTRCVIRTHPNTFVNILLAKLKTWLEFLFDILLVFVHF